MRLSNLLTFVLFLFFVSFYSCSSDPCETVTCVNGACDEGICACATGWKGPACDEIDYKFVGEYRSTGIEFFGCPNASSNQSYDTNTENQICSTSNNVTNCFEVFLRVDPDGSFVINIIEVTITPNSRSGDSNVFKGTYTTNNNELLLLIDGISGVSRLPMDMTQETLEFTQTLPNSDRCGATWTLTRQ